jgi:hypothetical protein
VPSQSYTAGWPVPCGGDRDANQSRNLRDDRGGASGHSDHGPLPIAATEAREKKPTIWSRSPGRNRATRMSRGIWPTPRTGARSPPPTLPGWFTINPSPLSDTLTKTPVFLLVAPGFPSSPPSCTSSARQRTLSPRWSPLIVPKWTIFEDEPHVPCHLLRWLMWSLSRPLFQVYHTSSPGQGQDERAPASMPTPPARP